jgi:hypothetical protein
LRIRDVLRQPGAPDQGASMVCCARVPERVVPRCLKLFRADVRGVGACAIRAPGGALGAPPAAANQPRIPLRRRVGARQHQRPGASVGGMPNLRRLDVAPGGTSHRATPTAHAYMMQERVPSLGDALTAPACRAQLFWVQPNPRFSPRRRVAWHPMHAWLIFRGRA